MFWRATAIVTLAITCKALGDDARREPPPCSAEAMRYVEQQKQAHIAELRVFLKNVSANARASGNPELIARKRATLQEIRGLQDGSRHFIPTLPTVEFVSRADNDSRPIGTFPESENRFLVVHVIGPDAIEARQIIPTISITAVGAAMRQGRGADKIGPIARFTGINTTGMDVGSEVRLAETFEAVGRIPSSAGGECQQFSVVAIPKPSKQKRSPAKERASGEKNTQSKKTARAARESGDREFPKVDDKPQSGGEQPQGSDE